ncbi:hypothetical protein QUF58_00795 [Anaerolineales bacterium HSG24]|nr:hypothetical protein [Anaerolineales bacterium HSG24]
MLKKVIIGSSIAVLALALIAGLYDFSTGTSSLEMPTLAQGGQGQGGQDSQGQGTQDSQGQGTQDSQGQGAQDSQGQGTQDSQGQGAQDSQGQDTQDTQDSQGQDTQDIQDSQGQDTQDAQGSQDQGGQGQGGIMLSPDDWLTLTGEVVAINQNILTVDTAEQGQLELELGRPDFAEQQNVTFAIGDEVTVQSFTSPDNDMLHAGSITNETTDQTLHLRDPNGRPLWAGQGQAGQGGQGQAGQGQAGQDGQGQGGQGGQGQGGQGQGGQGQGGQGQGGQGQGGQGQGGHGQGDQGQGGIMISPDDWLILTGEVVAVNNNSLTVDTTEQGQLDFHLGRSGFAAQQNVSFAIGDGVTVQAFTNNGMLQAGSINNETTSQTLHLRDPNGRPLWAGQGQGNGQGGQGQGGQGGQGQGGQGQGGQGQGGQGKGQGGQGRGKVN